jgi:DNA-nicking Smr family endonuclease
MRKRSHKPDAEAHDTDLFRASVSDVTPLRHSKNVLERPRPRPVPVQRLLDERAALHESLGHQTAWEIGLDTGEELSFLRHGVSAKILGNLRRGHWVIQDHLDLHGSTSSEARELLAQFLAHCARRGLRCVRIVHGKGLRSKNREPVLKRKVAGWLMQRDDVLAFCQAKRPDGGGGAVVVLLKGRSQKAEG